jgi:hypothetical protein
LLRRSIALALLAVCLAAAPAQAADPIMPLSEVRAGMQCTGLSVVRGTEISSFDVEILDVLTEDPTYGGARILFRASGPAVDATGLGPGFSGSPILCDGRNAGAVSFGIGEYGNKVALATPIEEILTARPAEAPAGARRASRRLRRSVRPLAGTLTVTGLSAGARRVLSRAAGRADRLVLFAPAGPFGGYPQQELRPGASVAANISVGDVSIGGVGTVAYVDGQRVYGFGHSLEGIGRRALFMTDAYVFAVVNNPVGIPDFGAITYKLASPGGHPVGTLTNDTLSAIYGVTGPGPPTIPLRVSARDGDDGSTVTLNSLLADERALGFGAGISFVSALASQTAIERLIGSAEPITLKLCARFRVSQLRKPIGFCNPYFDPFSAFSDLGEAGSMVDFFDLAPLDIDSTSVSMVVERGVIDDVIVGADAPRTARRGSTVPVRISLRRRRGEPREVTVKVPVPRDIRPGTRTLVVEGNGFPADEEELILELIEDLGAGSGARASAREPRTPGQLARQVAALRNPLGIVASFRRREPQLVLRSDEIRFSGRAKVRLKVVRARR